MIFITLCTKYGTWGGGGGGGGGGVIESPKQMLALVFSNYACLGERENSGGGVCIFRGGFPFCINPPCIAHERQNWLNY